MPYTWYYLIHCTCIRRLCQENAQSCMNLSAFISSVELFGMFSQSYFLNKRPMGHIAHLRNQFKTMKRLERSYDYIYNKISPVVQEEKTFKFRECTFAICLLSPDVKCVLFYLSNLKSSSPRDAFCRIWLTLAKWFCRRLLNFRLLVIIPLGKNAWPFIE